MSSALPEHAYPGRAIYARVTLTGSLGWVIGRVLEMEDSHIIFAVPHTFVGRGDDLSVETGVLTLASGEKYVIASGTRPQMRLEAPLSQVFPKVASLKVLMRAYPTSDMMADAYLAATGEDGAHAMEQRIRELEAQLAGAAQPERVTPTKAPAGAGATSFMSGERRPKWIVGSESEDDSVGKLGARVSRTARTQGLFGKDESDSEATEADGDGDPFGEPEQNSRGHRSAPNFTQSQPQSSAAPQRKKKSKRKIPKGVDLNTMVQIEMLTFLKGNSRGRTRRRTISTETSWGICLGARARIRKAWPGACARTMACRKQYTAGLVDSFPGTSQRCATSWE